MPLPNPEKNTKAYIDSSVKKIFDSFAQSERNQIIGLFDFIGGRTSDMGSALRKKNFFTFAKLYNGPGRATIYADRIKTYHELFKKLMQTKKLLTKLSNPVSRRQGFQPCRRSFLGD